MRTNAELLKLYKEEKALVIGDIHERTGLEPFPSFKEWKEEYLKEYAETHVTVSISEADRLAEETVKEAERLAELAKRGLDPEIFNPEIVTTEEKQEVNEMTETTETKNATSTKVPSRRGKATSTAKTPSKASEARKIFNRMYPKVTEGKKARKDVITAFVEKAGLTPNGASTYYQKFKKEADSSS